MEENRTVKHKGLTEAQVQNQCLAYLSARKIFHWRQNTGAVKVDDRYIRFSVPGISDIIGMLPNGRFLAIEVKREIGGKLSAEQKDFLDTVNEHGGFGIVVCSVQELIDKLAKVL